MVIGYPDVSKDFPKLIRTLASMSNEFDYWDDLIAKIYKNANNSKLNLQSYFKKVHCVHLDRPYPTCPDIEDDWMFLKDRYVNDVRDSTFKVDHERLNSSALRKYADDENLPNLVSQ